MKNYTNEIRQQTLAYTVFDFTPDEGSLVFCSSLYHAVIKQIIMIKYSAGFNHHTVVKCKQTTSGNNDTIFSTFGLEMSGF